MRTERSFDSKDVSLQSMVDFVESFFSSILFSTKRSEKNGEYSIAATGSLDGDSQGRIDANIFLEDERIIVELVAGENVFTKMSGLTSLLWGGYPTLRALKSAEILRKIEQDFYAYIEKKIEDTKVRP